MTAATKSEELVYAPAIIILANDLYPKKLEIVREYVQNASDAIDMFRPLADFVEDDSAPVIKISIHGRSLIIWDNGIGMDSVEIQKLKRVAYSEKKESEHAGYKGIGRLAGTAVAEKLIISSTSYGDPLLHKFEFNSKALIDDIQSKKKLGIVDPASEVINKHTQISTIDVAPEDHYTMVELHNIDPRHEDLLNTEVLREYIGEMAPVGFAPDFMYGERVSEQLRKKVPSYSPKTIWLTTASDHRSQIYKPYRDDMSLAEPEFIEVDDPANPGQLLAFCWYSTKGKQMLGKMRPVGNKFSVAGNSAEEKKRLAGLAYKLFGFSVGGRNLSLETLWVKDYTRALWFTGEIHIVDNNIKPTTDRSAFIDNPSRERLYEAGRIKIAKALNARAQVISDDRQAFDIAEKAAKEIERIETQFENKQIDRADLGARKRTVYGVIEDLKARKCKNQEIEQHVKTVNRRANKLKDRLESIKTKKEKTDEIADLAKELQMTAKAKAVYTIIMNTIEGYFKNDTDSYYELSAKIRSALKKRY